MEKKSPQRMCVACRQMQDKCNLLRIVKNKENDVFIDTTLKANGRGAYFCKSLECITKCIKTKAINRTFSMNIKEEIYEKLREDFLKLEK